MTYKLVSFDLCPFVQRSVITLEEKDVPYEIEYIDLADKPDWFSKISPFGKVPLLLVDDSVLFESAAINEFVEETAEGKKLHPTDAVRRAHNRAWIEFASSLIMDGYMLSMAKTEEDTRELAKKVHDKLARLEGQLGEGPYFNGPDFSLVDAASAPMLQRLAWCVEVKPDLGVFDGLPKIAKWTDALLARDSVKNSTVTDVRERFLSYLKGGGSPTRKEDPSWLGTTIRS